MKKKILYWKCQLIGWSAFMLIVYVFNHLVYPDELVSFIPFAISIFILGLVSSHLMRWTIKKFRLLKKKFATQIISLSLISIIFSFAGTFIWMVIMIGVGLWQVEGTTRTEWISDFIQEFFFNLFPVLLTLSGWVLIYFLFHYVRGVRKEERLRIHYKLQAFELEAKALRAQMNPHFIFNCLNSIKLLIQDDQKDKSVTYLTTFSKLIRTLFNNADKKEISLYDEIETCRLYLQLEAMRFDTKFSYTIETDPSIDMKSISIPALIVQPFIENAIWHGIVPKGTGGHVYLGVVNKNGVTKIIVDDDGIGRLASQQNKTSTHIGFQSKGINLTHSRLELDNLLQQRQAKLETIDKTNENGETGGTTVIISLSAED